MDNNQQQQVNTFAIIGQPDADVDLIAGIKLLFESIKELNMRLEALENNGQ